MADGVYNYWALPHSDEQKLGNTCAISPCSRRLLLLASGAATLSAACLLSVAHTVRHPVSQARLGSPAAFQNRSVVSLTEGYDANCWTYTGGTCSVQECHTWRNATCTKTGPLGFCLCPTGCAGSDFACHSKRNELVAKHITFASPDGEKLYAPNFFHTLKVGQGYNTEFNVHKIPGAENRYVIAPVAYLDRVLQLTLSGQVLGSQWSLQDTAPGGWVTQDSADPSFVFLEICRVQEGKVRIGIPWKDGAGDMHRIWAYTHGWTYFVYGFDESLWGKPVPGTVWTTSVEFAGRLDVCSS